MNGNQLSRAFPWLAGALLIITLAAAGGAAWLRWGAARPAGTEPITVATTAATPAAMAATTEPDPLPSPAVSSTPTATGEPATPPATHHSEFLIRNF